MSELTPAEPSSSKEHGCQLALGKEVEDQQYALYGPSVHMCLPFSGLLHFTAAGSVQRPLLGLVTDAWVDNVLP